MANQNSSERKPGFRRGRSRYFSRRKVCAFCVNHITTIDYKNVSALERYVSDRFKIESRRKSGACSKHQRLLARAIKRARHAGMLPFTSAHKFGNLSTA